jgi:hypothetical protein
VRVCPAEPDETVPAIAATDTYILVNCPALGGGGGDRLAFVPSGG